MNIFFIIIVLIIFFILFKTFNFGINSSPQKNKSLENYMSIDNLDVYTQDKYKIVYNAMLRDITDLLDSFNLPYWATDTTLLDIFGNKKIKKAYIGNLAMLEENQNDLLALKTTLNQMGYNIVKYFGGFRIYPFNGVSIDDYNVEWEADQTIEKDIEDRNFFNYKEPFINIVFMRRIGDIYQFPNYYLRRTIPLQYYKINDLFPLKNYSYNNFTIKGPNNPISYLRNNYGNDWFNNNGKEYYNASELLYPRTAWKVSNPLNSIQ